VDTELVVLVVEDDPTDFAMLARSLRQNRMFELVRAESVSKAHDELTQRSFDLILLDLALPDSQGLETVKAFTDLATTPVVVLSGSDDESLALEAVQHGAQDYLVKGNSDTAILSKTLRYAIERYRLLEELHDSKVLIARERELRRLEASAHEAIENHGAANELKKSLRESDRHVFEYAIVDYCALLEKALEQRSFKVENNLSLQLRSLAETLGSYNATPRDIVELHTMSVSDKIDHMPVKKIRLCNEEARYLLTGLLGHLCSFYKMYSRNLPAPIPLPIDSRHDNVKSASRTEK